MITFMSYYSISHQTLKPYHIPEKGNQNCSCQDQHDIRSTYLARRIYNKRKSHLFYIQKTCVHLLYLFFIPCKKWFSLLHHNRLRIQFQSRICLELPKQKNVYFIFLYFRNADFKAISQHYLIAYF